MACGTGAQVAAEMNIPVISSLYPENPGYELYRPWMYAVETDKSAAAMRMVLPAMVSLMRGLLTLMDVRVHHRMGISSTWCTHQSL